MKSLLYSIVLIFTLYACGNTDKEVKTENNTTTAQTPDLSNISKEFNCSESFSDDYPSFLSVDEMAEIFPFDKEIVKVKEGTGDYGFISVKWPSDRMVDMEVRGRAMKYPDDNSIMLRDLSFYKEGSDPENNLFIFNNAYRPLSNDDISGMKENIKNSDADDQTKDFGDSALDARQKMVWEPINNLATSAWYKWSESEGGELAVLAGRAKFYVVVKISADPEENKKIAILMAQKALSKCN